MRAMTKQAKTSLCNRLTAIADLVKSALNGTPDPEPVHRYYIQQAAWQLDIMIAGLKNEEPIEVMDVFIDLLRNHTEGLTARQIYRQHRLPAAKTIDVLDRMVNEGRIVPTLVQRNGVGRRAVLYRLNKRFNED